MLGSMPIPQTVNFVCYEDPTVSIKLNLKRENGNVHNITALFSNKSAAMVQDLKLSVAVQKYMTLQIFEANGKQLGAFMQDGISQEMKITNTSEGSKPLSIKIKVTYAVNG